MQQLMQMPYTNTCAKTLQIPKHQLPLYMLIMDPLAVLLWRLKNYLTDIEQWSTYWVTCCVRQTRQPA